MPNSSSHFPLRFAIVGCGSIASTQLQAIRGLPPEMAAVVACVDIDPERASQFAVQHSLKALSWEDLLVSNDVDAVTFCTPSGIHAEQGVQALRSGKHVIVEKPMDVNLAACDALIQARDETGLQLAVVSQHRFDPASIVVHNKLSSGELGNVILAEARIPWFRTQEYYDSGDWRGTWAMDGGGCVMNQGVHTVDLLRWFCGAPKRVHARMNTAAHTGIEVEDSLVATVEFQNGALATILASTSMYPGFPASLMISGTKGTAMIEGDELKVLAIEGQEQWVSKSSSLHALQVATGGTRAAAAGRAGQVALADSGYAWGDAHREQFRDFVECCRTGRTPVVSGHEGRNSVELVLALYESAKTGCEVVIG